MPAAKGSARTPLGPIMEISDSSKYQLWGDVLYIVYSQQVNIYLCMDERQVARRPQTKVHIEVVST